VVCVVGSDVSMGDSVMVHNMVARMGRVVSVSTVGVRVWVMSMTSMAVGSMSTAVPAMAAASEGQILPGTGQTNHRRQSKNAQVSHGSGLSL